MQSSNSLLSFHGEAPMKFTALETFAEFVGHACDRARVETSITYQSAGISRQFMES